MWKFLVDFHRWLSFATGNQPVAQAGGGIIIALPDFQDDIAFKLYIP
jgi:hypothetical protein